MKKRINPVLDIADAISVARNTNFNRLWSSQILSQVAQNLLNFALIIRIFQLAEGTRLANISVALLILSFGIPSILFGAAAGVYVDHWNKRTVLIAANIARAVLVLGYLFIEQNLWLVLILSFAISTASQFFGPAESAAIPNLVKPRQLLRANSLFVFTLYGSFIAGYSASAPIIALFGASGPYYLTCVMFLLAGILNFMLPSLPSTHKLAVPAKRLVSYTLREIRNNWRLIKSEQKLLFPITQLAIGQTLIGVIMALAPALAIAVLGVSIEKSSHFLIIPVGIGLISGVIAVGILTQKFGKARVILSGFAVSAFALIALGSLNAINPIIAQNQHVLNLYQIGPVVAVLVFLLGFSNAVSTIAAQTILQVNTTEGTRGKVFGALNTTINVASTLPILFAGILADFTSVTQVIVGLGVILLIIGIVQLVHIRRSGQMPALDRQ